MTRKKPHAHSTRVCTACRVRVAEPKTDYCLACQFEGAVSTGEHIGVAEHARPRERRRMVCITRVCSLCGDRDAGAKSPDQASALVAVKRMPRTCARCGSQSMVLDEVECVAIPVDAPYDYDQDRPRRGRPPRWLVEARRRAQAPASIADYTVLRPAAGQ